MVYTLPQTQILKLHADVSSLALTLMFVPYGAMRTFTSMGLGEPRAGATRMFLSKRMDRDTVGYASSGILRSSENWMKPQQHEQILDT